MLAVRQAMDEDNRQKILEALEKFHTVMVISEGRDGSFHGRPMAIAKVEKSGDIWFVTSRDSEKTREIAADARVVITAQEGLSYVSLTGQMDVVLDPALVRKLWRDYWRVWFPRGEQDPDLVLLRFRPDMAEYWTTGGLAAIRYFFNAAKALLNGERMKTDDGSQHVKVQL